MQISASHSFPQQLSIAFPFHVGCKPRDLHALAPSSPRLLSCLSCGGLLSLVHNSVCSPETLCSYRRIHPKHHFCGELFLFILASLSPSIKCASVHFCSCNFLILWNFWCSPPSTRGTWTLIHKCNLLRGSMPSHSKPFIDATWVNELQPCFSDTLGSRLKARSLDP